MLIQFQNNITYEYRGVPAERHAELIQAEQIGAYLATYLHRYGAYFVRRVETGGGGAEAIANLTAGNADSVLPPGPETPHRPR